MPWIILIWCLCCLLFRPFRLFITNNCHSTTAILMIKAYVETYEVKIRHQQVDYKNYPQTTHTVIGLILASTVAFNCALWAHYGWNTPILLGVCFFGIILQFMLLVPTYVQNIVGLAAFTFILQEYSGVSMLYWFAASSNGRHWVEKKELALLPDTPTSINPHGEIAEGSLMPVSIVNVQSATTFTKNYLLSLRHEPLGWFKDARRVVDLDRIGLKGSYSLMITMGGQSLELW